MVRRPARSLHEEAGEASWRLVRSDDDLFQKPILDEDLAAQYSSSSSRKKELQEEEKSVEGREELPYNGLGGEEAELRARGRDGRGLFTDNDTEMWQGVLQVGYNISIIN